MSQLTDQMNTAIANLQATHGMTADQVGAIISQEMCIRDSTESIVEIAQATPAACSVAGAPSPTPFLLQTIKDGAGNASQYPITFTPASGAVDGAPSYVIDTNFGSVTFYYNGTNTRIVA